MEKKRNCTTRDTQLRSHCSGTCHSLFQCCFVMVFQSDDCPVSRPILKGKRTSNTTCQRSNVPSFNVTNCSLVCRRRRVLEQTEGPPQNSQDGVSFTSQFSIIKRSCLRCHFLYCLFSTERGNKYKYLRVFISLSENTSSPRNARVRRNRLNLNGSEK